MPVAAPWSLFECHRNRPWPFFLDRAGAISYAGSSPHTQLVVEEDGSVRCWRDGRWHTLDAHPIDAVSEFVETSARLPRTLPPEISAVEGLPRTVGYLAYELGAFIEDVPVAGRDPAGLPLAVLSTYDRVDAWNPETGRIWTVDFTPAGESYGPPPPPLTESPIERAPSGDASFRRYSEAFARIQAAIRSGDIYQANLSRRIDLPFRESPASAYAQLRERQPMPHGAFLDFGSRQVLCNSPECFLRVRAEAVETAPIKGTRPRHADARADRAAALELASDCKERAEHLMIVDLERNDLGRVCRTGSVQVPSYAEVATYSTVHHLVSTVRGRLSPRVTLADVLRATFPGGSITGAPKVRAMEIIAEVECAARGIYTGAIGCWNGAHTFDLNVAIRTAVVGTGRIQYCTGGGIVADSALQAEYEETVTKARAFLDVLGADERSS